MSIIKPMNYKEFARYVETVFNNDTNAVIEFACDPGSVWPQKVPDVNDCECWYFAKLISIPEYNSRFIVIDYCGGEEAYAVPVSNYTISEYPEIIEGYMRSFWNNCVSLGSDNHIVFVEIKEKN